MNSEVVKECFREVELERGCERVEDSVKHV